MPPPPPPPAAGGAKTLTYAQKKEQELVKQMDELSVDADKVADVPLLEEERKVLEEKDTEMF